MAEKISKLAITVDLQCHRCYKKIQRILCDLQERERIQSISFEDAKNTVTITGPFDPTKLSMKLRCKAGKVIKDIKIIEEKKKEPEKKDPPKPEPFEIINDIKITVDLPKDLKEEPKEKPKPKPEPKPKPKPKCVICPPPPPCPPPPICPLPPIICPPPPPCPRPPWPECCWIPPECCWNPCPVPCPGGSWCSSCGKGCPGGSCQPRPPPCGPCGHCKTCKPCVEDPPCNIL